MSDKEMISINIPIEKKKYFSSDIIREYIGDGWVAARCGDEFIHFKVRSFTQMIDLLKMIVKEDLDDKIEHSRKEVQDENNKN